MHWEHDAGARVRAGERFAVGDDARELGPAAARFDLVQHRARRTRAAARQGTVACGDHPLCLPYFDRHYRSTVLARASTRTFGGSPVEGCVWPFLATTLSLPT